MNSPLHSRRREKEGGQMVGYALPTIRVSCVRHAGEWYEDHKTLRVIFPRNRQAPGAS